MKKFESIQGKTQADPEIGENRLRECKWEPSVEFKIPDDWVSGVYLGKLTTKKVKGVYQSKLTANKDGLQSYVIFIVRDDRPCDLLFQCSDLTWQAYNSVCKETNASQAASGEEAQEAVRILRHELAIL